MANFGKLVFTKEGMRLKSLAEGGTPLVAKRIAMGSGNITGSIYNMTVLANEEVSVEIKKSYLYNENSWLFEGYFDNETLEIGFEWRELGLFMTDPEDASKEILYCYSNAGEASDYIPPSTDERYEKYIQIQSVFSNAQSVTIEISESITNVNKKEYDEHVKSNKHIFVCDALGDGSNISINVDDVELKKGLTVQVLMNADIQDNATLSFNGGPHIPIMTANGVAITEGAKSGMYLTFAYTGSIWVALGYSSSAEQITRNKETIIASEGQTVFILEKGVYTMNANCVDLYINGVAQPDSSFIETDENTITLKAGVEENDIVMFDYMLVSSVINSETPAGAQMKVDELEKKTDKKFESYLLNDFSNVNTRDVRNIVFSDCILRTFLIRKTDWNSSNEKTIQYDGLTNFSCIEMRYADVHDNIKVCENSNIKMSSCTDNSITLLCESIPESDAIIEIIYQGERNEYYEWDERTQQYLLFERG